MNSLFLRNKLLLLCLVFFWSEATRAQKLSVLDRSKLSLVQNRYQLTALDSAGWVANYPNLQYVVLHRAPFPVHKVRRWGTGYQYSDGDGVK